MNHKNVYIAYAKRTPIGAYRGKLSTVRVDDLLAVVFEYFKNSVSFDLEKLDDVIVGCANQAGEDNRNLARMSLLLAGFPMSVPAVTVNRLCGSSLDAVIEGFARISCGMADSVLVGGAENMSRAPLAMSKAEMPFDTNQKIYDTALGWRFPNPKMPALFPLLSMGETAEEVATKLKISRDDQDAFALGSHVKAIAAQKSGLFDREIIPVDLPVKKGSTPEVFSKDEGPRSDTNLEKLSKLKPIFRDAGSVTAGNSSSLNDGASAVFLCSEEFLKQNGLTPLAQITGFGVRGVHPSVMGLGPVEAVKALCAKFNKNVSDFDLIELNEAFAAQALGCVRELNLDESKINVRGGAIALGHPLGCSGTRILTTLIHTMRDTPTAKTGLATMCIGVGQGIALSIEKT